MPANDPPPWIWSAWSPLNGTTSFTSRWALLQLHPSFKLKNESWKSFQQSSCLLCWGWGSHFQLPSLESLLTAAWDSCFSTALRGSDMSKGQEVIALGVCSSPLHSSLQPRKMPFAKVSQVALMVKNPPASVGDARDVGSISESGRFSGEGNGYPLQYSAWEAPWTEEPIGLQCMERQRLGRTEPNTGMGTF